MMGFFFGVATISFLGMEVDYRLTNPLVFLALIGLGILGLADDLLNLSVKLRIVLQFLLALSISMALTSGTASFLMVELTAVDLAIIISTICAAVFLVGLINIYNFMDGIDGLAAIQTIFICFTVGILTWNQQTNSLVSILSVLAITTAAFLLFNWHPAKIFLGDCGSTFLGGTIGALALYTITLSQVTIVTWLILLCVFITDTMVALIGKYLHGTPITAAHCSHAYQNLARRWKKHSLVTLSITAFNIVYVLPLAYLSTVLPHYGFIWVIISYLPITLIIVYLDSGKIREYLWY